MKFLSRYEANAYFLLRIIFGFLFTCHGLQKVFGIIGGSVQPVGSMGWISGVIELVCGILIFLGLLTRIAAFIASGEMAVGYFIAHDHSAMAVKAGHASFFPIINGGELAVIYCFVALFIACRGAGRSSALVAGSQAPLSDQADGSSRSGIRARTTSGGS